MRYISMRVVRADNHKEAVKQVVDANFDESDDICDRVIPLTDELDAALAKVIEHYTK